MGRTMPSAWPNRASSRWSGVTSGFDACLAASMAELKASWTLSVQRFGSSAMRRYYLPLRKVDTHTLKFWLGALPVLAAPAGLEHGRSLADGDQLAAVLAMGLGQLGPQPGHLGLQLQHPLHAVEVEALVGQLLDAAELLDVGVAVPAAAAGGARRVDQPLALVDAQGLRMDPGQLGGHRDHIHRPRRFTAVATHRSHPSSIPRCARGDLPSFAAASASTALRSSSVSFWGTATSTVTSRSPVLRDLGTPLPLTRSVRPERVPAGMRTLTEPPSRVGTRTSAPSTASGNVTGTVSVRLSPRRPNSRCGVTRVVT